MGYVDSLDGVAKAKIWLNEVEYGDNRIPTGGERAVVGEKIALGVARSNGRMEVAEMWPGAHTTVRGRLVGLEWHELTDDGPGPGVRVSSTRDEDLPDGDHFEFELTVATQDSLPH